MDPLHIDTAPKMAEHEVLPMELNTGAAIFTK
jgi:hypothetical protein